MRQDKNMQRRFTPKLSSATPDSLSNAGGEQVPETLENDSLNNGAKELTVKGETIEILSAEDDPDITDVNASRMVKNLSDDELVDYILATFTEADRQIYSARIISLVQGRLNSDIKSRYDSDPKQLKKLILGTY